MKKKAKRIVSAICALAMCAAMVPAAAFAEETTTNGPVTKNGVTINKTATDLDENDQTKVTLTIGAEEDQTVSDVVFVLDKSVSIDIREAAAAMLDELMTRVGENRIQVGVVVFNKSVYESVPLTELNEDSYDTIRNALMAETSSGTNIYAGLKAGKELLDADASVDAAAKHLVLVTDGVTYLWGDGRTADGSDIYTVYSEQNGNMEESLNAGNDMMQAHHPNVDAYYDEFSNMAVWMTNHTQYGEDAVTYQHVYGKGQYQPDVKGQGADSTYLNADFKEGDYIPGEELTQHGNANDIAVYMAATVWKDIVAADYNAYAYAEQDYAVSYPWGPKWVENLSSLGGYSSAVPADTTGMFNNVKSNIIYALANGTVTDTIYKDFELADINSFNLTVGQDQLKRTVDNNGNTVNFGDVNADGSYPYTVTYDAASKTFTWKINTPVENANRVQLTYTVKLVSKATDPGNYTVPTNEEAKLDYTSTTGEQGSMEFPKPTVSYEVKALTPADPTYDELNTLLDAEVQCTTNANHATDHTDLLENSYNVVVDATKADALGNGATATVTVNSDPYVQHYNDNMNTGLTHTLASGAASTWTVQLVYVANETTAGWTLAEGQANKAVFYVSCPETTTVTVTGTPTPDEHPDIAEGIANGTWGAAPTATPAATSTIPQTSDSLPLGALIVVAIVAAGAVCGLVVLRKRNEQ
ncbi:vWA domain-containing protein [uncultured Gemmiger sp.]|uniref:vWA domain-containing protein n=1 Tax=uncultured Gemmiger sp. TaxID=1623490 RepID=UPI0025F8ED37|nr:vWA domain-containing protein [uncultured Gemmiger sp.]